MEEKQKSKKSLKYMMVSNIKSLFLINEFTTTYTEETSSINLKPLSINKLMRFFLYRGRIRGRI